MAFVQAYNPLDDETETTGQTTNPNQVAIGTSSASSAGDTQQPTSSVPVSNQPDPNANVQQGTGFANIQKYLAANQQGGQNIGAKVADSINSSVSNAQQKMGDVNTFAAANPTADIFNSEPDINAQKAVNSAVQKAELSGNAAGQTQLIREIAPNTSTGGLNLDQFLMQNSAGYNNIDTAAKSAAGLKGQYNNQSYGLQRNVDTQKAAANATRQGQEMARNLFTDIMSRKNAGDEEGARRLYNNAQKQYGFTDADFVKFAPGYTTDDISAWKLGPGAKPVTPRTPTPAETTAKGQQMARDLYAQMKEQNDMGNEAGARKLYLDAQKRYGFTDADFAPFTEFDANTITGWKNIGVPQGTVVTGTGTNSVQPVKPTTGVQPLSKADQDWVVSEATRLAGTTMTPQQALYNYAKEKGIPNSDVDIYMGWPAGTTQNWAVTSGNEPAPQGNYNPVVTTTPVVQQPVQPTPEETRAKGEQMARDLYAQMKALVNAGNEAGARKLYLDAQRQYGFTDDQFAPFTEFDAPTIAGWKNLRDGGHVNGSKRVPSMVSNGEYIIPAHVVKALGKDFFDRILKQAK